MAGPPAKAPEPDRSAFLRDKCHQKDIWHLPISYTFKWEYVCEKGSETKIHGASSHVDITDNFPIDYIDLWWNVFPPPQVVGLIFTSWLIICSRKWASCCGNLCGCVVKVECPNCIMYIVLWVSGGRDYSIVIHFRQDWKPVHVVHNC